MNERFAAAMAEVSTIVDKQGTPVDDGIKALVAALRMHGVDTVVSCEGHLDHGLPYPWVRFDEEDCALIADLVSLCQGDAEFPVRWWTILPVGYGRCDLVPWKIDRPLAELQADAAELARRLAALT